MSAERAVTFGNEFKRLDALIDGFREALVPPNQIPNPTPSMTRTLVVAHSIAHSATVRLQSLFAHTDVSAKRKRLAAARSGKVLRWHGSMQLLSVDHSPRDNCGRSPATFQIHQPDHGGTSVALAG
jgi:hypothetical protein